MNPRRRMKPGSMGRGRVNAGLASLVPSAALTRPLPMLVVKQADGGGMATINLRQRDSH